MELKKYDISDSTKYALGKCDENIDMFRYECIVQYANTLLNKNKMIIVPKKEI